MDNRDKRSTTMANSQGCTDVKINFDDSEIRHLIVNAPARTGMCFFNTYLSELEAKSKDEAKKDEYWTSDNE